MNGNHEGSDVSEFCESFELGGGLGNPPHSILCQFPSFYFLETWLEPLTPPNPVIMVPRTPWEHCGPQQGRVPGATQPGSHPRRGAWDPSSAQGFSSGLGCGWDNHPVESGPFSPKLQDRGFSRLVCPLWKKNGLAVLQRASFSFLSAFCKLLFTQDFPGVCGGSCASSLPSWFSLPPASRVDQAPEAHDLGQQRS